MLLYSHDEFVEKAYFVATAPIRGFEKLVVGKNPVFVINAVMRICGICHAAHDIASSEAFEDAMGLSPPMNGRLLREVIGLINRIQSHILHLTLLLPGIFSGDDLVRNTTEAIELFNIMSDIMGKIGGSPTHPPNIVIGGVSKLPEEKTVSSTINLLEELHERFMVLRERIEEDAMNSDKIRFLIEKKISSQNACFSYFLRG